MILSAASSMSPLGLLIVGPVADAFGQQIRLLVGGLITGALGISGLFIPAVMNFEEGHWDNSPAARALVPREGN